MTSSQNGDPHCVLRVWLSEAAGRWSRAPGSLQVLPCLTPSADSSSPRTYKTHYDGAASRGYRHQQCRGEGVTSAHDEWQCSPILSTTKKSSGRMRQVRTVRTPETCNQCMKMNAHPVNGSGHPPPRVERRGARTSSIQPTPAWTAGTQGKSREAKLGTPHYGEANAREAVEARKDRRDPVTLMRLKMPRAS